MTAETVPVLSERYGAAYKWLVTGAALVAMITMVLSSTSATVAVPDVMGAFGVGQDQAQWLSTGFFAAQAATMLLTAWLVATFGQRLVFQGAMLVFVLAAFTGGFAPGIELVILARVVQGGCAGILQPLAMATIFTVFPPERRGTAMGLFGLGVVMAPALGPALGGLAVDTFNWRWVFFLPLPPCFVAMILGTLFMPQRAPDARSAPFDWTGIGLLCLALLATLDAFASGQREGWSSDRIVVQFVVGFAAAAGFILWSRRARAPLLDLRLFANLQFSAAFTVGLIFGFGMFGSIYITSVFVQTVGGYSASRAGLVLIPGGLLMAMMFPISGRLSDRMPAHLLIMAGLVLFGSGFLLMGRADADTPFWTFVGYTLVNRAGLSLVIPALNTGALRVLRPDQLQQGAGIINFTRMLGGACGTNLMVVLLETRTRLYSDAFAATQNWANHSSDALLDKVRQIFARAGVGSAQQRESGAIDYLGQMVHAQANTLAFQEVFLFAAALSFAAILPALLMGRRPAAAVPVPPGAPAR